MRLATWNLEYARGAEKIRRRLELLAAADADVWVLTETHDQLDLAAAWGSGWSAITSTPRPDRTAERWVAIWTRLPVRHAVPTADPCRTAAALLESPAGPLLVHGTVLPWHSDRGPDGSLPNWSEHHRVIPDQGREWAQLRDAFPAATLCVAGDLNTTVDAAGYGTRRGRELLAAALDGADLACSTGGPTPTAHLEPSQRVERAFIDHVCVSRSIATGARAVRAWEGRQHGVRLSDHAAVVVEVPALDATPCVRRREPHRAPHHAPPRNLRSRVRLPRLRHPRRPAPPRLRRVAAPHRRPRHGHARLARGRRRADPGVAALPLARPPLDV